MKTLKLNVISLCSWGLLVVLLGSCDIINPEEPTPAYLYIEPFSLTTDLESEGTDDEKITEAWVFIDGAYQGAYSLPALVPILASGDTEVRVEAGVRENGLSATPDINPFFEPFRVQLNLVPTEIDTIRPATRYVDNAKFAFIEDFEPNRVRIFTDTIIGPGLSLTQTGAFEGQYAGTLMVTKDLPLMEVASRLSYSGLLDGGVYAYLEVNYRAEAPVIFGIIAPESGNYNRYYDPGFLPKDSWNKIYFNLAPVIFNSREEEYQIAFQALLPTDRDSARIWIDNIKLVHF